jgi:hypothetical protein
VVFKKIPDFQPIPFEKIGLRVDEYRRTMPTDAEIGRSRPAPSPEKSSDKNFGT